MGEVLELANEQLNTRHELIWHVVVQDVHVDSLVAACHERTLVFLVPDALANTCDDQCPGEDSFQVPSWHLQNN